MKNRVEVFNELKKLHLQSESPFDSNDGCYVYDALMNIAGSLAVIADIMKAKEESELAEKHRKYNDRWGQW